MSRRADPCDWRAAVARGDWSTVVALLHRELADRDRIDDTMTPVLQMIGDLEQTDPARAKCLGLAFHAAWELARRDDPDEYGSDDPGIRRFLTRSARAAVRQLNRSAAASRRPARRRPASGRTTRRVRIRRVRLQHRSSRHDPSSPSSPRSDLERPARSGRRDRWTALS